MLNERLATEFAAREAEAERDRGRELRGGRDRTDAERQRDDAGQCAQVAVHGSAKPAATNGAVPA